MGSKSKNNKKSANSKSKNLFDPANFIPPADRAPLYLQGSCRCGKHVFRVGPFKDEGLQIVNCHCQPCRSHAGAAWATWLTNAGHAFDMNTDLEWIKGGEKSIKKVSAKCGTRKMVLLKSKGKLEKPRKDTEEYHSDNHSDTEEPQPAVSVPTRDADSVPTSGADSNGSCKEHYSTPRSRISSPGKRGGATLGKQSSSRSESRSPSRYISLSESGEKYLCSSCYSVMLFKLEEDASLFVPAMGVIDDGNYPEDECGRVTNQKLWPSETYPDILHEKSIKSVDSCANEKGKWYIKQAKCPNKLQKLREKKFKNASVVSLHKKAFAQFPNKDPDAIEAKDFYAPLVDLQSDFNLPEISGSCLCGACSFECIQIPGELQHCYCSSCRKNSGAGFMTWASCENNKIRWMDKSKKKIQVIPEDNSDTEDPVQQTKEPATEVNPVQHNKEGSKKTKVPEPSSLLLKRTTEDACRHYCTDCGTNLSIVYDEEAATTTWLAAGLYHDVNPGADNFVSKDEEIILVPKEKHAENHPSSGGNFVEDAHDKQSMLTTKYFEKRVYYVGHICCASLQPWYKIPNDVGTDKVQSAS